MALDTQPAIAPYDAPIKDLYEIGEMPPLGHVPAQMYGWAIRRERHGPPDQSMQLEALPTWSIGDDEVLVLVMEAGRIVADETPAALLAGAGGAAAQALVAVPRDQARRLAGLAG